MIYLRERQLETSKSQILEFLNEILATGSPYVCSSVSIAKKNIFQHFMPFSEGQTDAKWPFLHF